VSQQASIRAGIGGWTFEPWRETFYPPGLPHKQELEYASRQVTTIEVNGTYYRTQTPDSFARWHDETPEDFVFALKAPRFVTNRRVLAEAGPHIERFLDSGLLRLQRKLGPINWQFQPTKQFQPEDFAAFLRLLPAEWKGTALRHVVEVRHASFVRQEFVALLREREVAVVVADHPQHPAICDATAPFIYARLQSASEQEATGYSRDDLALWAKRARAWVKGQHPPDLPRIGDAERGARKPCEVFIYMINGFKPKAPAAAKALLELL